MRSAVEVGFLTYGRGHLWSRTSGRLRLSRLRAEVRPRRSAALQWPVPALSMAARFVAVSLLGRIHIARWYRGDNHRVGLHRRCTDRHRGRPCDVRIERQPSARNQVQLRWFRVSQPLDRRPDELALLAEYGREIQGMFLHSYLFFGSANRLHQHVKALLAKQKCRFLLFDFRLVTGIDSSATFSFTQIKQVADQCGARMIFTRLTRDVENAFRAARFISDHIIVTSNLDAALESCEKAVIEAHQTHNGEASSLREWFTEALGGAENADQLIQHCKRMEVQPDEIIVREGDPADSMHFILDGRVGITVNADNAPIRV